MNQPVFSSSASLLACARHVAKLRGYVELEEALTAVPAAGLQESMTAVRKTARSCRLAAETRRLKPELPLAPAVVELKTGRFLVLLDHGRDRVTLYDPQMGGEAQAVDLAPFLDAWSGGVLTFDAVNSALACFVLVAREHKIDLTPDRLAHEYGLSRDEIAPSMFLRMAKEQGLQAGLKRLAWDDLPRLNKAWPAIAVMKDGGHMLLGGMRGDVLFCYDPLAPDGWQRLKREEFTPGWTGKLYLLKRSWKLSDPEQPFGLRWFLPEILRQKAVFFDIALAVLFISAIALVTPIFFQIVIDKVLVNQALTTLHTLGIGMAAALVVNAALDFLRDYLLLHATNKIDLRVTGRTFRHLLSLPLQFFEKITAGVITKHIQQTARIREFLTGQVFLTMLETVSLFVFLPFLFFYSVKLTAIVLTCTGLIATIIAALIVPFKRRLNALYEAEGKRQAMLVETINGMATVKAMAIEPLLRERWEDRVASTVDMQFRVGKISITARSLTQFMDRFMTVILIWVGAGLVFEGSLTVGALIAFQMLAGRVTSPLVRLVGLIHQYQEAALSVEKLGIIMNAPAEWGAEQHGARPKLTGDIVFERVNFRYGPDLPDSLKELSLTIPAASVFGLVGPSGSGKTTLTRLLQKVCLPTAGTIRMSGCYLNEIDTAHLRRRTGVVLQESFLFRDTVAGNIRAGQSKASREEIIRAAVLAGADEFIVNLPQGYDTMLEEGASNLSGGQRQRLAIARALLTDPEILIFDEATSSLDPESERIIRENLKQIARNRTVIIVSHRLSMLKDADNILVLERGKAVGLGPHERLLAECPLYKKLWTQQMGV